MPKLTKRVVDDLRPKPGAKDTYAWDTALMPSGVGSYVLKYRNSEGRQRKLALGRIGTLTPDEARQMARARLVEVANGHDPSTERREGKKAITVAELCDLYLEDAGARVKPSTLVMDRSRIECHVKPLLGHHAVAALTLEDVERLQSSIANGRSARPRRGRGGATTGGTGVAARTVGMLGTILELARRRRIIKENPARGIRRLPEGRQRRFLSINEIAALGAVMRNAPGEFAVALAAIRLLLLTGCRRAEALALPWAWVDRKAHCIRFGDTKAGPQLRPIGDAAIRLLASLSKRPGCPYVFPSDRTNGHFVGLPRALDRLCARASLVGITVHVLRHSFAAAAAEIGFSELTIAGLLGHNIAGVTARYAHVPDSALIAAANRVSDRIATAMDGLAERADVVTLHTSEAVA